MILDKGKSCCGASSNKDGEEYKPKPEEEMEPEPEDPKPVKKVK